MVSYQKEETPKTGNLVDKPGALFFTMRKYAVPTKTWNDLKQPEMIYNDLKQSETNWNNLQRAWKRPETTYNEQEMTWNDLLETTWNSLKQPRVSKKQRPFHLFFKLISDFFDLIYFMGVAFNSSTESWWGSASV